jgi:hypothetical protein
MAVCQNLVPLVNIKIAGKWMFIPLKMVCIGIDPYPYGGIQPKTQLVKGWPKNDPFFWHLQVITSNANQTRTDVTTIHVAI